MTDYASFRMRDEVEYSKISKMLVQMKQGISDVTAITPVYKDPALIDTVKVMTPLFEELTKVPAPESTYRWEKDTSDNFAKFVTEATAASAFGAQKGTYGETTVTTKLLSYVMNIGLLAQKNTQGYMDLARHEQEKGLLAVRKAIERALIQGHPAGAAADGGPTDSNAFGGLLDKITSNTQDLVGAALQLENIDDAIDALVDYGVQEQDIIMVTDSYTKTTISSMFYNTFNTPLESMNVKAGLKVASYRQAPIFASSYMPKTAADRRIYFLDRRSTVLAEFYQTSQLDLGRTTLSDDSIMFWMGALAVKDTAANAMIDNIL